MPNGIFPVPNVRTNKAQQLRWGARTWAVTRLRRSRLDEQLAAGAKPNTSTPLGLRAAQLSSRNGRAQLANALVEAVGEAHRGEPMVGRRAHRAEVRDEADVIIALASRLREPTPIDVRGAAKVALLVNDGASPLNRAGDRKLSDALTEAYAALIPAHDGDHELPAAA